ncbi:hypothetical protein ACLK17_21820 [Escherichia coli]
MSERWEKGGTGGLRKEKVSCNGWKRFRTLPERGGSQQVELPPFAEFWQANQLIEMPENPDSERFIRFADFCRDPLAHPLKTASGKIEIFSQRIADYGYPDRPGIDCGWSRTNGRAMPTRTVAGKFLPIRRTACTAS